MVVWKQLCIGGIGILVKKELCEKVVDVWRKSDRVMVVVLAFGKQVIRAAMGTAALFTNGRYKRRYFSGSGSAAAFFCHQRQAAAPLFF